MKTDDDPVTVFPLAILHDNYVWCIRRHQNLVVIDPGEADAVLAYCQQHQCVISHILITHFHDDHVAGIADIRRVFPHVNIINSPQMPYAWHETENAQSGDWAGSHWQVYRTPGHRPEHMSYLLTIDETQWLFCGDVLFSLGCGRLSDGITPDSVTIAQRSLVLLRDLPDETWVCCTHEYTLANSAFVLHILPERDVRRDELQRYQQQLRVLDAKQQPSLPTRLGFEKRYNPFLQWDDPVMIEVARHYYATLPQADENDAAKEHTSLTSAQVFGALRALKNQF
jgi:hydroxyacylglutathione hydrolase